ncbi:MAG: N-succinylarginine dihydrolase [Hyphomonadaceae bacterium]|nr:N-succinylarginine dihydrolase [Hyphomonadaceae bacterium]
MNAVEINFDGLIGPTHNYAGLSDGNIASASHRDTVARPRQAALEGIAKMRRLMAMGAPQGVLPPHERPPMAALRALGFAGDDKTVWAQAWRAEPRLMRNALAASAMWAANAATVSPGADCADGRVHLTPANLHTMAHRALEADATRRALARIFADPAHFAVHAPLPAHGVFADEGAANHMRLCAHHGAPGVEVFVYGREGDERREGFPARQTLEACRAIARRHGLDPARTVFARQSDEAIAAGAFHNDVVAVADCATLFHHAQAFADPDGVRAEIAAKARGLFEPVFVEAPASAVSLADAIGSYLFNAQLVTPPGGGGQTLIAPQEVADNPRTRAFVDATVGGNGPIAAAVSVDVRESMKNGGGPACLRLRVVVDEVQRAAITPGFLLDGALADRLEAWVMRHYRETLGPDDLSDPALLDESRAALDALCAILPLGGGFYPFQRT